MLERTEMENGMWSCVFSLEESSEKSQKGEMWLCAHRK